VDLRAFSIDPYERLPDPSVARVRSESEACGTIYHLPARIGRDRTNYPDAIAMRRLPLVTAILVLFIPTMMTGQSTDARGPTRSYSTRFRLDEDPISEGGRWLNGGSDGLDWFNVVTRNGIAHGTASRGEYTDPTALLAGTWGKDQKVKARVFSRNPTEKYYQEVEIRLRSSLSPRRCTGYEVFWRCLKTPNAYVEIVRWNGKVGDWTSLKKLSGARYGVKDGDLVEATIVGNVIKGFINGVEVISVTDDSFKDGSPGMGFNYGVGETNGDFGFTLYEVESYGG
jgi:hypothetical protein